MNRPNEKNASVETGSLSPKGPLYGIGLKILSVMVFTTMAALIKATSEQVPSGQAVFFRSFFAIPPIALWLMLRHQFPASLKTDNPWGHFWRGLVGVTAMACGFTALGLLPFPEVVAIGYASPLIATILAAMFLGERLRLFRLTAVAIGLVGVFIILGPKLSIASANVDTVQTLGAMFALLGALFAAMAQVFVRKLVTHERTPAIVFWFSTTSAGLSLLTLPFGWVIPDWHAALLLIAAGVLGGIGQILLTESYRHAETAVIASFEYVSILLALAVGWFIFSEAPTNAMLVGAAIVVCAGLVIVFREHQLGMERARARKVMTPQG